MTVPQEKKTKKKHFPKNLTWPWGGATPATALPALTPSSFILQYIHTYLMKIVAAQMQI